MTDQKVWFVTGAGRGLGVDIAQQALAAGHAVTATGRNPEAVLQAIGAHENLLVVALDITDPGAASAAAQAAVDRFGRIDVLVNNAAVAIDPRGSRFLDSKLDTYRETLEVNLFGPLQLAHAVVPLMKANRYGRIVNMSSGLGQLSSMGSGTPAYRISKAALNALTRIVAAEFSESNILVNSMCPGWVRTRMGGEHAPRTVQQGADTAVWLATLPDGGPSGGFFRDRQPIPW